MLTQSQDARYAMNSAITVQISGGFNNKKLTNRYDFAVVCSVIDTQYDVIT
jgi:hypothetical protein